MAACVDNKQNTLRFKTRKHEKEYWNDIIERYC